MKTVAILGGGIAGITAAVYAQKNGWKPILFEAAPSLGGRARTVIDNKTGLIYDNGQHVLSAAYAETRYLLETLNSENTVSYQKNLSIQFKLNERLSFNFTGWKVFPPFHFLFPLLKNTPLSRIDRKFLFRFGKSLLTTRSSDLETFTVREWLDAFGEAPFLEKLLWEPITLATLNTQIHQASASLLYTVLKLAFIGTQKNSGLGIPNASLDDIFVIPAKTYFEKNDIEINTQSIIRRLIFSANKVTEVENHREEKFPIDAVICALPPNALAKVLDNSQEKLAKSLHIFPNRFEYSPIITVYFWLKKPFDETFPTAFIDSSIQWLFELPKSMQKKDLFGYSIIISAANREVDLSSDEIVRLVKKELLYFYQRKFTEIELVESKVIKEKRATFLQTPASLKFRADTITSIKNVFLAGDWTNTNLPATIESAVLSGKKAADALNTK